jgi:hypothetical protein
MNDEMLKNFEARIEQKKASKPKLHRYDMDFRVGILCENDEDAEQKSDFVIGILKNFSDVVDVEKVK